MNAIETRELTKVYQDMTAVDQLNRTVREGSRTMIDVYMGAKLREAQHERD